MASLLCIYCFLSPYVKLTLSQGDSGNTKTYVAVRFSVNCFQYCCCVLPQFFLFVMAIYAGDAMMGNFYDANNFAVVLTFLTFPITNALFPAFSKLDPKKRL